MNELIEQYLPLVQQVVNRLSKGLPSHIAREDLVSMGTLGLIGAVERYTPERGVKFETFATWRIRGAVLDGLREMDWVPRQVRLWAKEIERSYAFVEANKKESATDEEVAAHLGISQEELQKRLTHISAGSVYSLEEFMYSDGDDTVGYNGLPDFSAENPDTKLSRDEIRNILVKTIDRLPEKEKMVVALYYYEELSFKEIAEIMQVSSARISQLHTKAICRLRGALSRKRNDLI
ncbi:FliA/WhiG family RNA polymerase sigma factor [Effusibacillus dendaii]|uniref:RNA polymerase sigma factor n=1 Tax=Effusibacillus dendaii TaxID=2743772 RepID=A0A7I8D5E7_9BACL|nr:FliA/WhiG family RNA polymerase sigma factor [Effusibacillus dendaii]BCJ85287.1 RNA polymerase sigma factor [Effusibacillus dendaii]